VAFHHAVKAVTVSYTTRETYNVNVVEEIVFNFMPSEDFELVMGTESTYNAVAALH
jgi:hypothetical protein